MKIVIPEGALDEPKEIEIKKVKMKGAVSSAFQISPDIKFKIPAEISIKYENNGNIKIKTQQKIKEEEFLRIAFYDTNGKTWVALESYFDGQRVFAKTDHLSTWAIVSDMLFPDPSSSSSSFSSYEPPAGEVPPLEVEEFSVQNFRMSSRFSQKSESELSYEEFSIGNFASILRVDEEGNVWFAEHGFLNQYATYIGKLDTRTGQVKLWWLPAGRWVSDIEVKGRDVWIVLRLGPDLVRFNMDTETFRYFRVPSYIGSWPYEIDFDEEGNIWMTVTVGRAVAKFDVRQESFVFYFRIPVGWWTAGVKVDGNKVWVTETYSCVGPFIYYVNEGRLKQLYPSERFCPGTFYILEGKAVGGMGGDRLGILDEEGVLDVHGIGLEFSGWIGVREEDRSVWAGGNNYVFWYSVGERVIKGRANFESGAGVIAVEVDFEGNAWAILRNVKKVVKIRAKPVVLGCDKTCGEGFEGTPLIQVGSWGSVSANSGRFAVNLVSGNLYLSILLIPTFDELMKNFTIYYNSLDFAFPDALGNGWTHSFLSYVKETANGVVLKLPDGKVIKFSRVGDRYLPEHFTGSSNFKYLLRTPEGWKLYKMGGEVWEFAQDGKLILIKDVKGRNWNLIYNNGLLIEVRDPVSRSLKFYYDQKGRIVKVENPAGSAWEFFYDGDFLSAVKDPLGNLANFRYNENGLLSEYIDFIGARWNIVYDDRKRATHIFDHLSRPLKIEYKDDDTVVVISRMGFRSEYVISRELVAILKLKNEIGTTLEYFYDNKGNKIKFRDSRGGEWTYEYDELGRLIKEVDPIGRVAIYEYNDLDLLTREIDTLGRERKLFYDSRGNLIREIDWAGNERKYEYNDLGLITKEINPIGAQTIYFYDRFGHISKKVDPLGNEWRYEYDILGLLLKEENPLGGKTLYFYDKLGNKIGIQDARGNVWSYEYHVKLKIKEVYPLGGVKRFWYDYAGRLTAEQNTLGYVKFFIYDADGNLVEEIDFAGNRTKFFYDFASNMTAQISALGGIEQYCRDFAGDITLTSLPTKLGSLTEYDILGRPVKVLYGKLSSFIPLVEIRNFFIAETD